jgi:E3 ubiquitin-protein ligase RNF115/126
MAGGDPRNEIAAALNQLFAVLNPGAGPHGDAVYSQEALDRIISNLMEANPQSNAPPPASTEAIANLPRRNLDEEMLGPEQRGECTICIDEMHMGDEVLVLPCNHWFHEECAVLWLREHNTCPICRAPIEGSLAGQSAAAASGTTNDTQPPSTRATSSSRAPMPSERTERLRSQMRQRGEARLESIRGMQQPYDRRNPSRRNSNSPPSANSSSTPRYRSPSPSSRRSGHSDRSNNGGNGALGWLRDTFSGNRRRS